MDSLDLLEMRIQDLESQILPKNSTFTVNDKSQAIADLLLQTLTMTSAALSCRESITTILAHMTTLNECLDPNNGEDVLEVEAKRQYLLEMEPELVETLKKVSTFENTSCYIDSTNILKVSELTDKLKSLVVFNVDLFEESKAITNKTVSALQEYNDIIWSIKVLFSQLDKALTELEAAVFPKMGSEE